MPEPKSSDKMVHVLLRRADVKVLDEMIQRDLPPGASVARRRRELLAEMIQEKRSALDLAVAHDRLCRVVDILPPPARGLFGLPEGREGAIAHLYGLPRTDREEVIRGIEESLGIPEP